LLSQSLVRPDVVSVSVEHVPNYISHYVMGR